MDFYPKSLSASSHKERLDNLLCRMRWEIVQNYRRENSPDSTRGSSTFNNYTKCTGSTTYSNRNELNQEQVRIHQKSGGNLDIRNEFSTENNECSKYDLRPGGCLSPCPEFNQALRVSEPPQFSLNNSVSYENKTLPNASAAPGPFYSVTYKAKVIRRLLKRLSYFTSHVGNSDKSAVKGTIKLILSNLEAVVVLMMTPYQEHAEKVNHFQIDDSNEFKRFRENVSLIKVFCRRLLSNYSLTADSHVVKSDLILNVVERDDCHSLASSFISLPLTTSTTIKEDLETPPDIVEICEMPIISTQSPHTGTAVIGNGITENEGGNNNSYHDRRLKIIKITQKIVQITEAVLNTLERLPAPIMTYQAPESPDAAPISRWEEMENLEFII